MTYIFDNSIQYKDGANLDAFGRLRTSSTTCLLDIKHLYDKLPYTVSEATFGSATSLFVRSTVNMTVFSNDDYVIRQTIKSAPYQSGKSQIFEGSFDTFNIESGVIKRVGYFTSEFNHPYSGSLDGFFLESNGDVNEISFQIWSNGTRIFKSTTDHWSSEDLDINLIDWSLSQLIMTDFQWLGVGRVRLYLVYNGTPRLMTEYVHSNNDTGVYMLIPNKPIRYEIRSTGGGGTFNQICSGVSMEGSLNSLYRPAGFDHSNEVTLSSANVTYAMLGVRLAGTGAYMGTSGYFSDITILSTTSDDYLLTLQIAPTLSKDVLTWTALPNTPFEVSLIDNSVTIGATGFIANSYVGKGTALSSQVISLGDNNFSLGYNLRGTPQEWWVCITPFSGTAKYRLSGNIRYFQ